MKPEEKALLGYLHHVRNTKLRYRPPESLTRHVGQAIYKNIDEQRKALRGILHHNSAVKPKYKLPGSLIHHVQAALGDSSGALDGVSPRTRKGVRVRFAPSPGSLVLYSHHPAVGEEGTTTTMPGFGSKTYLPGPGGGLLYVNWDDAGTIGVSPNDLKKVVRGEKHEKLRVGPGRPGQRFEHDDVVIETTLHPVKGFGDIDDLDAFTRQYIETALWSSTDEDEEPLDKNYGIEDLAPEALVRMVEDSQKFQKQNWSEISGNLGRAGHDFWLTRNGHGAGFWDGDWPDPLGDILTAASEKFKQQWIYVGDDGKLYVG